MQTKNHAKINERNNAPSKNVENHYHGSYKLAFYNIF
jgi:hypothetical protein